MITLTIDGQAATPSTAAAIKLTRQNHFIKDSDSFTYDIALPLNLAQNRRALGNLQRMDVRKTGIAFDECVLQVDGHQLISGKGTVTAVTQEQATLQIKSPYEKNRYPQAFYNAYINRTQFAQSVTHSALGFINASDGTSLSWLPLGGLWPSDDTLPRTFEAWAERGYIGHWPDEQPASAPDRFPLNIPGFGGDQGGAVVFPPIYDSAQGRLLNVPGRTFTWPAGQLASNTVTPTKEEALFNPSPCFSLDLVVGAALLTVGGYAYEGDFFDDPLVRHTFIASGVTPTSADERTWDADWSRLNRHLPTWTLATLIDEVRLAFNLSVTIDEAARTVRLDFANRAAATEGDAYKFEPLDEFTTDYDEDGAEYISASNVAYDIDNDNDTRYFAVLTQDMRSSFPIADYDTPALAQAAGLAMDEATRRATIFRTPTGHFFFHVDDEGTETFRQCARFTPIIRDSTSDTQTTLRIVPCGWGGQQPQAWDLYTETYRAAGEAAATAHSALTAFPATERPMLTLTAESPEKQTDATLQDVAEGNADAPSELTESSSNLYAFLLFPATAKQQAGKMEWVFNTGVKGNFTAAPSADGYVRTISQPYTDGPQAAQDIPGLAAADAAKLKARSLALTATEATSYVGQFHQARAGAEGTETEALVDTHTKVCIRFRTDGIIPLATRPYLFHGKRYVCERLEAEIADGRLPPVVTGYFYEVTQ